jgi:hypothetical protein
MVENVAARTGASRKLENERKQQIATGFLFDIPEIEVKVGHDGGSSIACGHDVLDDGGTGKKISSDRKEARKNKPDDAFPRARYDNIGVCQKVLAQKMMTETHAFRESIRGNQ